MENLIPVINKLQDAFASVGLTGMDLPQIAVVGSQSSGKSSVLESVVGRDFLPRGSGIVTRRPLVLQLNHHNAKEEYGVFLHDPKQKYYDFAKIRLEIQAETDRQTGQNKGISAIPINLKIYSPNVINLTLIDLPGLTKVAVGDQPPDIERQIREMVELFIEKESCLILAVSPANSDIANSDALQIAKHYDPTGDRTIGVLTKLDLMDEGTDALDILQNRVYPLKHGFVGVVNRSQKDINNNQDVGAAISKESDWFANHEVYSDIKNQCGTKFLQDKLRQTLIGHIQKHLPILKSRLLARASTLERDLTVIGSPLVTFDKKLVESGIPGEASTQNSKSDMQNALLNIIRMFGSTVKSLIDGHDGDLSSDAFDVLGFMTGSSSSSGDPFRNSVSSEVELAELNSAVRIKFIFHDLFPKTLLQLEKRLLSSCMDEEIRTIVHNVRGLRAGLFVPDAVFEILVKREILRLLNPAIECVDSAHDELVRMVNMILKGRSSPIRCFPQLQTWMMDETYGILDRCKKPCLEEVKRLVDMEVGYINTNHPDFIGKDGIGKFMADEMERRAKDPKGSSSLLQPHNKSLIRGGNKEGYLTKLGGTRKNWKRRWFILKNGTISFYDSPMDKESKGSFELSNCVIRDLASNEVFPDRENVVSVLSDSEEVFMARKKDYCLQISSVNQAVIFRNHRQLFVVADSEEEKNEWVEALAHSIEWCQLNQQRNEVSSRSSSQDEHTVNGGNQIRRKAPPPPPPLSTKPKNSSQLASTQTAHKGRMPALPDQLYASDVSSESNFLRSGAFSPDIGKSGSFGTASGGDDVTITLVRTLLHSYFVIVRKHIQDLVPKAIMLMMISKLKKGLPNVLSQKVLENNSTINPLSLLEESPEVQNERETKTKTLNLIRQALHVIETDVRADLLSTR